MITTDDLRNLLEDLENDCPAEIYDTIHEPAFDNIMFMYQQLIHDYFAGEPIIVLIDGSCIRILDAGDGSEYVWGWQP